MNDILLKEKFETDDIPTSQDFSDLIDSKVNNDKIGVPGGTASLNESGKIPTAQLPASIAGGVQFKGFWNADADLVESDDDDLDGAELPTSASGNNSYMLVVKVGATVNRPDFAGSPVVIAIGDAIISNGATWDKIGTYQNIMSVNGKIGVVVLDKIDIGLGNVPNVDATNASNIITGVMADARLSNNVTKLGNTFNGVEQLVKTDLDGKILSSLLPALAITDTYVAANEAAMLALSDAETGDICIRTDENKSYVLQGDDPSELTDWKLLLSPGAVISVNGQTGIVVLDKSDVGLGNVPNVDTTNADNISSGTLNVSRIPTSILRAVGQLLNAIDLQGGNVSDYSKSNLYLDDTEATMGFGVVGGLTKNGISARDTFVKILLNQIAVIYGDATNFDIGDMTETKTRMRWTKSTGNVKIASGDGKGFEYEEDYSATFTNESLVTKRYVLAIRDALLASAPGALDTLDELAAALGDDANFAATVTAALAAKEILSNKDTDNTLAANSDDKYASQKAVKAYIDAQVATLVAAHSNVPNVNSVKKDISKKTDNYTFVLTDKDNKAVLLDAATDKTFTIPHTSDVAWSIGDTIDLGSINDGVPTISPAASVTLLSTNNQDQLRDKGSPGTLTMIGANVWWLFGDLK